MLSIVDDPGRKTTVRFAPAQRLVVAWATRTARDTLELRVHALDGRQSLWLPYVAFDRDGRASLDGFDPLARLRADVVEASAPLVAVDVRANEPLDRIAVATPPESPADPRDDPAARGARLIELPKRSQFLATHPGERGWCNAAALAMLLAWNGIERDVPAVAGAIRDGASGGTGTWTFATAFAGSFGLIAPVAYLRDLAQAARFIAAGIPLALSIAWTPGGLPGAPLPESAGHLVVLRGFDGAGDPIVNDPAQPDVLTTYPAAAFERCWIGHGGAGYAVVKPQLRAALLAAADA